MDELDALRILRRDKDSESNEDTERKEQEKESVKKERIKRDERLIMIYAAILGFLIISFIYSFLVHPIDKVKLNMALTNSYAISTTIGGKTTTVLVDGNLIKANDQYYELDGENVYVYSKDENGKWEKKVTNYFPQTTDESWMIALLDKENYKRNILPWKPMEYTGRASVLGMKNLRTSYFLGKCSVTGTVEGQGYFGTTIHYYATIEIDRFGLVFLRPPKIK